MRTGTFTQRNPTLVYGAVARTQVINVFTKSYRNIRTDNGVKRKE